MLYTVIYTVIHWVFFIKGQRKKYISFTASKVTQLFFLFDSQLIRHWNRAFLPITRRLSYLHTQRFSAKLKTIIPKNFLESIVICSWNAIKVESLNFKIWWICTYIIHVFIKKKTIQRFVRAFRKPFQKCE